MPARLEPMTDAEYAQYLPHLIADYAKDNIEADFWDESEAMKKSKESVDLLLPNGLHTEHHHLFTVWDRETAVGRVWLRSTLDTPIKTGFIFDIEINVDQRGKGYGRQAMELIEAKARQLGIQKMGLHVFAKNKVASKLYESLGYEVKSMNMDKVL